MGTRLLVFRLRRDVAILTAADDPKSRGCGCRSHVLFPSILPPKQQRSRYYTRQLGGETRASGLRHRPVLTPDALAFGVGTSTERPSARQRCDSRESGWTNCYFKAVFRTPTKLPPHQKKK